MYYGDYGNYENRPVDRTKLPAGNNIQKDTQKVNTAKIDIPLFNLTVAARSTDALGIYNQAFMNIGQTGKRNLEFSMNLTDNTKAMVGKYVTPEQQVRVSEDFLSHFA